MSVFANFFKDDNTQTSSVQGQSVQQPSYTKVTTTSGKQYTLDQQQYDWITSRYKGDMASTYGFDDADQQAKAAGQMSAAARKTYGNSNVDRQLAELGLPSERNLEKYLEQYDQWHTGGIRQVFGNDVPDQSWQKIGELFKLGWEYDNTPEDQHRKRAGLMPSSVAAKYTDTEIDDDLKAHGLPAYSELGKYTQQYANYMGIDSFYRDAAAAWTNLQLRGIENNDTEYEDEKTGETHTGKYLYEKAFYDTLERKADDGSNAYGAIYGLLKSSPTESEAKSTGNYRTDREKAITGSLKSYVDPTEYDKYNAFSYDDFAGKYDDYYNRHYANYAISDGLTVADALATIQRDKDAELVKKYYDITEKDGNGDGSVASFIAKYKKDYPGNNTMRMFVDMHNNGVSDAMISAAYDQLMNEAKKQKTNDMFNEVRGAWRDYKKWSVKPTLIDTLNTDMNVLANGIESYIQYYGGYTPENIQKALEHYRELGVSDLNVNRAADLLKVRYAETATPGEATGDILASFSENYRPRTQRENDAERTKDLNDYLDNVEKVGTNDEAVSKVAGIIDDGLRRVMDPDDGTLTPGDASSVVNMADDLGWTNENAVRLALQSLGFSPDGNFTGFALEATRGWTTEEKNDFLSKYNMLQYSNVGLDPDLEKALGNTTDTDMGSGLSNFFGTLFGKKRGELDYEKFNNAVKWAEEKIASGELSEFDAYNTLASIGLQEEIEQFMGEEWHRIVYENTMAPALAQSDALDAAAWENMTPEEREAKVSGMWAGLTPEEKAATFSKDWWKFDQNIRRTNGQAWEQQFSAVIPSVVMELSSGAVEGADMLYSIATGKPALWDETKRMMELSSMVQSYGSTVNPTVSQQIASVASDATAELIKMQALGTIGGAIGESTTVGKALSYATNNATKDTVKWMTGFALDMLKASPFVVNATAQNFAEAKEKGATNAEAVAYGIIVGSLEGVWEGMNFDKLWGRVVGQDKFAEMLVKGGNTFKNAPVVLKARLASMLISGLSEFTEESASYVAETFWKTHSDWFGGTGWGLDAEWSAEDWIRAGGMGFITGLLGAGLSSGSINEDTIMIEHYKNSKLNQANRIDMNTATRVVELASDAQRERWKNGTLHVMSMDEYAQTMREMDVLNRNEDINAAQNDYKKAVDQANKKYDAVKSVEISARGEMAALDPADPEYASKMGKLTARIAELSKNSSDAALVREDEIQKAQAAMDNRIDESHKAREAMNAKIQEHFAGLYYSNQTLMEKQAYSQVTANVAKAMQDGAETSPEIRAQEAEAKAESTSKLAEAEANETVAEAEQAAQSPEDVATKARELAYNRVYKDQEAGKAYAEGRRGESDSKMTRVQFAENERQNFQAKTTARLRRVTLELAGLEAKEGMSAKEIFDEAKKAMTPEAAQKLEVYQKLSKALGLNMVVRDVVAGTSGYVHDGKLYVTLSGKQSLLRVAAHELTHYMHDYAGTKYDALRGHLIDEVGGQEAFDQKVAEKAKEYGLDISTKEGLAEADDELCAELCEKMLENKDALERFVNADMDAAKTLKTRLAKTLVAIKSAIRSLGTSNTQTRGDLVKEQETIELWYKGLSDAIDAANAEANAKPVAQTEAETVTTEAQPQAPPTAEANPDLYMDEESARREQLRSDLLKLAEKGTRVKGLTYQEVNDVLDRVIFGDKSNYNKADYAQIRGMLAQLIPEVTAVVNEDANVDLDALNERVKTALDYMLSRYQEASDGTYNLAEVFPNKIALTEPAYRDLRAREITLREASNRLRNALGGKFVSFVYKKSPEYRTATKIDQLWQSIGELDPNYDADTYGNVGEDALALIEYAERKSGDKSSFDELYGSQRADVVASQVGEFLDAVQSMVEGKNAGQDNTARHMTDAEDYSNRPVVDLSEDARLPDIVSGLKGAQKYKAIQKYILDELAGLPIHFNDGTDAVVDKSDASHIASGAGDKKTAEIDKIKQVIENAELYATDDHAKHNKFNAFKYYESIVKFGDDTFPIYLNVGRAMNDGSYHLYDITHNIRESAGRINGLERAGGLRSANGFSDTNIMPDSSPIVNPSAQHSLDDDYMPLAEKYDAGIATDAEIEEMQRDVEEAAAAAGFPTVQYDPVVYDQNGDIVPLSDRFSTDFTGNRYTVDNDIDELVKKYGAKDQGRQPRARDVQVPERSADNMRVSDWTRSVTESNKTNDATSQEILSEIGTDADRIKQRWSYLQKSNKETFQQARDFISERQPGDAMREFHDMVMSGQYSLKAEAIGLQLLADAADRGDWASVKDLSIDLRVLATDAGQRTQLFNALKELKGVGSAWYLENLVKKLNVDFADEIRTGEIDGPITVSDETMNKVRAAKTAAEIEAAEALAAKELAVQLPLTWDEKLSNWRYLSMLGNPVTHFRNITGNKLMYRMSGMKDIVASGIERILSGTNIMNESDKTHARLTSADKAYWDKFAQESYEEQKRNLQGGGKLGFRSELQQAKRMFNNKVLDTIARGTDNGTMSERKGIAGLIENIKNNGVMGMLEVEDAWGLKDNYKRSIMEYMKAQGYTLNNDGKVGKVDAKGNFTEISDEAMNAAIEWATNQAWTNTFRGPSQLATELNKISKMNKASKLIVEGVMPFKKTPINIAKVGGMYSPAGIVIGTMELLTKVKQGKMSAATAIDHLSSGLTGTALLALGAVLAKAGILRGGGEDKEKYETYLQDTGDQTYSFKFGNASINMSAIAPATIPLFMGVALEEMVSRKNGGEGVDLSTITDVLAGTLNPFMEMSFMSSLNSALQNYNNDGIGGALGGTIMTAAQNYGSQYLPTIGGKVAQFIDPTQRTTKSDATSPLGGNMDYYWRSLVKKVPGAEATLQPDVNVWGQTNTKDSFGEWALDFANKFILPTTVKVSNRDAVDNELIRLVESTGEVDILPSDGNKYFKVKGETYKMNASQYTLYSQERGQAAYAALKSVMASDAYRSASDEEKHKMLKKALDNAYLSVNNTWKEKLGAFDK